MPPLSADSARRMPSSSRNWRHAGRQACCPAWFPPLLPAGTADSARPAAAFPARISALTEPARTVVSIATPILHHPWCGRPCSAATITPRPGNSWTEPAGSGATYAPLVGYSCQPLAPPGRSVRGCMRMRRACARQHHNSCAMTARNGQAPRLPCLLPAGCCPQRNDRICTGRQGQDVAGIYSRRVALWHATRCRKNGEAVWHPTAASDKRTAQQTAALTQAR